MGAAATVLGKGAVLLSSVASIPIMAQYLGAEQFGVWMTISTAVSMLLVLDLGIANALVNFVSEAYANDDREHASTYSTTAFAVMVVVACLFGALAYGLWPHIQWFSLLHLKSAAEVPIVSHAWAAAVAVFLFGMPAGLALKILGGYQELRSANLFTSAGSVSSLVLIFLLVKHHAGLTTLVAASFGALVGANLLCLLWLWYVHKPWLLPKVAHLSRSAAQRMLQSGGSFFVLQIAALLAFNSANLIVTHYLGPVEVASYSVAWRLTSFAAVGQSVITPALWPAYAEAFARSDIAWVRRTFYRTMWVTMLVAVAFCLLFGLAGRWIIARWASRAAVPSEHLLLLMCSWVLLNTLMNNTSVILVGKGQIQIQAWISIVAAVLNVVLSVHWVQRVGAAGAILGTIVSYLLVIVLPQFWQCYRLLHMPSHVRDQPMASA